MPRPARRLALLALAWAVFDDAVPIYPLYALLFADSGLSQARISALFVIWSAVSIVTEIPTGALADRFSRRAALVAAGVLQGCGYALWVAFPGFAAFGAGFALWGLGGSLASGALEALLYDGFAAEGASEHYSAVLGAVTAVRLITQVPVALLATVLFAAGGFALAGWVSVGSCLMAAALATRLPEPHYHRQAREPYFATLRSGLREVAHRPGVRTAVLAVAVLTALDAAEEYFPLLARGWGVPDGWVPLAVCGIPLAGAAGAALAGAVRKPRAILLGLLLGASAVPLWLAWLGNRPAGLAGIACFYLLYQVVLVVADVALQHRIEGPARATITSVAGAGTETATFGLYGMWALAGLPGMAAAVAVIAVLVAVALRDH